MTNLTNNVSSIEDQVSESFPFEVKKLELSAPNNGLELKTPCFGLFRSDNGEFIGRSNNVVSKHYVPHNTEDLVALTEAASTVFDGDSQVKCYWRDGHYVNVIPSKEHRRAVYGTNDNVFPRLIIRAGYDGNAFSATMGMYRDACQNLQMLQSIKGITVNIRHSSNLRSKMNDLIEDFSNFNGKWEDIVETIEMMENRTVNFREFITNLYPPPNHETSQNEKTRWENRINMILGRLQREAAQTNRPNPNNLEVVTGWQAYNSISGFAQHDQSRKKNPTMWDRIILASRDKMVSRAETLALTM